MEITGVYTKTVFRNESNGFTIFKFKLNKPLLDTPELEISCKGTIQAHLICTPLKLTGKTETGEYGTTFIVDSAVPYSDNEVVTIEYLSSNLFNGIAETTAKKIVAITGSDVFSFVEKENARDILLKAKGLPEDKIDIFINSIKRTQAQKEIFDFLYSYGGNFTYAEALFETYGLRSIQILTEKPYDVGEVIDLPFHICDLIAKKNGIKFNDIKRIKAIVLNTLKQCYTAGDMYVLLERVIKGVKYISKNTSAFPDDEIPIGLIIIALNESKQIITEIKNISDEENEIRYYLNKAYFDEKIIAENIARIQSHPQKFPIDIEKTILDTESKLDISYSAKQKECFKFLSSSGVKIITGGPGTGKSTVINGLLTAYRIYKPDAEIKIMAPTGRAAQRVSEITNLSAGTIHRMLNILPYSKDLLDSAYNGDYPADILIVDEASMIDTTLMRLLIKSIKTSALIILCGDINQLPSVGAGNVLHELISSGKIDTVHLDTNYRQGEKSTIIKNAISVNSGSSSLNTDKTFKIIECQSDEDIKTIAVKNFVDSYNIFKPYDVQILSSTKKGPAGTYSINKEVQSIVAPDRTVSANSFNRFRINDKVMTTKNNYELGYFNGDVGTIKSADENYITVKLLKDDITIPKNMIQDLDLAYACTVHKSQGSEYDKIIIALPQEPSVMLKRNLLYTAITRAKKEVVLIVQKNCIEKAVCSISSINRKSALAEKIINRFGGNK